MVRQGTNFVFEKQNLNHFPARNFLGFSKNGIQDFWGKEEEESENN